MIGLKDKITDIITNHCGWSVIDDKMIDELAELLTYSNNQNQTNNTETTQPTRGICVDGGTEGNPGPCFYRGVDIETNTVLFEKHLGEGTNNIAEFLAIVHAIHYCEKNNIEPNIWSDSKTAIAWVKNKKTNTTINGPITDRLIKACEYLKNKNVVINKWKTKQWGEIPADFGRK